MNDYPWIEVEVGNNNNRLFGGAQYHRTMREFTVAVRHMKVPETSDDEIAITAIQKAQNSFQPMLEALRHRSVHIMKRLHPIVQSINQSTRVQHTS